MTEALYLSRIALAQFRNFEKLDIELAPQPGVLIVHGSNGLGKSSLFDALEWTLTGEIDHFKGAKGVKKVGNYLCRWRNSDPGSTTTALTFSDGNVVERSLQSVKATSSAMSGTVKDVVSFLRAPDWKQSITSLEHYLLLTHFLGQSTTSRFTHRNADERFDMLKEAAQSDRIEAIADVLHGRGNTTASRAFTRRVDLLTREASIIRDLLDQEAELWDGAQASGAIDEAQGIALATQIVGLLGGSVPNRDVASAWTPSASAATIEELQSRLDQARRSFNRSTNDLNRARQVVEEAQRHRVAAAEASAALTNIDGEQRATTTELASAQAELTHRDDALAAAARELAAARSRHTQIVDLNGLVETLDRVRREEEAARLHLANVGSTLLAAAADLERVERRRQIVSRLEAEIVDIERELHSVRDWGQIARQWMEADALIQETTAAVEEISTANPDLEATLGEAERLESGARERAAEQTQLLRDLEASVGAISTAVTEIAASLAPDACECPVCASRFEVVGALKERAIGAAARLAPSLALQRQVLRNAQIAHGWARDRVTALREMQERLRALETEGAEATERRIDLSGRLRLANDAPPAAVRSLQADLAEREVGLAKRRSHRQRWRDRMSNASEGSLLLLVGERRRRRDEAARAQAGAERRLSELVSILDRTVAQLELLSRRALGKLALDAAAIRAALDQAKTDLTSQQEAYEQIVALQQEARSRLSALNGSRAATDARRAEMAEAVARATTALSRSIDEWASLGLASAEFDQGAIDVAAAKITRVAGNYRQADGLLRRLRSGREAWSRQQTHRFVLERLRAVLDAASHVDRDQLRAAGELRELERRQEATATAEAKEIARLASAAIYEELKSFNAEYIEPLDRLTKQINQAILCDPDVGIDLHVRDRRIEQSASRTANVPPDVGEVDPALVHSEGQMAALAVGMLCAASLTFPWSRWRAMVLDDPLQSNDAIHSAAFADVMGNLVLDRGYQIFLSTHDLAQAEFLQRKFDSRRIPCAVLHLLGQGRSGVEAEFRPARFHAPLAATA